MSRKTQQELKELLEKAGRGVEVGARYRHCKSGGEYIVRDIVLDEATESPIVIYKAEYGDKLTWVRPVDVFVEEVEIDGVKVPRFVKNP